MTVILLLSIPGLPRTIKELKPPFPVMMIPLEELLVERPKPKPKPKPRPVSVQARSSHSQPAPIIRPTELSAPPSEIAIAEPSLEEPEFGLPHRLFEDPPPVEEREVTRLEPIASPLPDIVTQRAEDAPSRPPAALPAPEPQAGRVYRGKGSPDLEPAVTPTYTGPELNLPASDLPTPGVTRGEVIAAAKVPGVARGDKYLSPVGSGPGQNPTDMPGILEDVIGEEELSGLLAWLRGQHGAFPQVVESYLETHPSDLRGVARYNGWEIFIQFSEDEHQLKVFLCQGDTGILLADSDFKRRSQLFGLGNVGRSGTAISSIVAAREKPTIDRTESFYHIFQGWMQSEGILMGSRVSR